MNEIIKIDVSSSSERRVVRNIENKKVVKITYPLPENIKEIKTRTVDEAFEDLNRRLKDYYANK